MIIVVGIGLVLALLLPWWSIAVAGAIGGFLIHGHRGRSFLAAFLGALLLWAGAAILMTLTSGSALPDMFAQLLPIPLNGMGLAVVAGVVGGIVAGLGGFTGDSIRRFADKPRR
jgi:hypothetical protein